MRPRVFPAEDPPRARFASAANSASMRPRVFPAEDPVQPDGDRPGWARFNEAAGIPRGRPAAGVGLHRQDVASMRPRVFPAEDTASEPEDVGPAELQ